MKYGINYIQKEGNGNKMKYIFITDVYKPYVADCENFNDAICEYKECMQGTDTYFNLAIQSLTPQQSIQLYNDLVYEDEQITKVYELGECIYDS